MRIPSAPSVAEIYAGSDGLATKDLYAKLEALGPMGVIAVNIFRACKASERAKRYRGGNSHGRFKAQAYEKKNWSLRQLCDALAKSDLIWGWKEDPTQEFHKWMLYINLPTGQVSFHAASQLTPERYYGEWDGAHASAKRIIAFADGVLNGGTFERIGPAESPAIAASHVDSRPLVQLGIFQ